MISELGCSFSGGRVWSHKGSFCSLSSLPRDQGRSEHLSLSDAGGAALV